MLPGIKPDVYCVINGSSRCFSRLFDQLNYTRISRTTRPVLAFHPWVGREFNGCYFRTYRNGIISTDHGRWALHKGC